MVFPIERLLKMDLGNPKEIKIDDIVESVLELNSLFSDNIFVKIMNNIVDNQYGEEIEKHRLKRALSFYEKYLSNQNKKLKELKKDEFGNSRLLLKHHLIKQLLKKATLMALPFEDKNIGLKREQFENDISNVSLLLRQMGKIEEAKSLLSIKIEKIHTYSSYSKEWKKQKTKLLLKKFNFSEKEAGLFLNNIIIETKEIYREQDNLRNYINQQYLLKKRNRKTYENLLILQSLNAVEEKYF